MTTIILSAVAIAIAVRFVGDILDKISEVIL